MKKIGSSQGRGAHGEITELQFEGEKVTASHHERVLGVVISRMLFNWKDRQTIRFGGWN